MGKAFIQDQMQHPVHNKTELRYSELGITTIETMMAMVMIAGGLLSFAASMGDCMDLERTINEQSVVHDRTRDLLEQVVRLPPDLLARALDDDPTNDAGAAITFERTNLPQQTGISSYEVSLSVPPTDGAGAWQLQGQEWEWLRQMLSGTPEDEEEVLGKLTPVRVFVSWKDTHGPRSLTFNTLVTSLE